MIIRVAIVIFAIQTHEYFTIKLSISTALIYSIFLFIRHVFCFRDYFIFHSETLLEEVLFALLFLGSAFLPDKSANI